MELIAAAHTLPAWLVAECLHDASKHVREMAHEYAEHGKTEAVTLPA